MMINLSSVIVTALFLLVTSHSTISKTLQDPSNDEINGIEGQELIDADTQASGRTFDLFGLDLLVGPEKASLLQTRILESLTLPYVLLFETFVYQVTKVIDFLFELTGYHAAPCRMRFICNLTKNVIATLPAYVHDYANRHVSFLLNFASLSSEYFDAMSSGFLGFNCTEFYQDPACP